MSIPVTEYDAVVLPEWIDSNGHLNLAYYVVIFDNATDAFYDALGIGNAYRDASGNSCFTAETHMLYEREVHVGDKVRVKCWLLGADAKFELEWVSVYTFSCVRMHSFRHGRVLFTGDAAHGVSPFGARGANSGLQDTDNLVWKLKLVMDGRAPERLLDTYSGERKIGRAHV